MNFSNISSYINIPTIDGITNFVTNIANDVIFCGRAIKQCLPENIFITSVVASFNQISVTLIACYCCNIPIDPIFNNINISILMELVVFYMFFLEDFILHKDVPQIIIKQFKDYQRDKRLISAINNLQFLPDNYNYNKAKECPITYDKLLEDATVCYGKTLYDANFLFKWLLEGHDIDPMTAQKINLSKLYKVSPATVNSILNSDC
jgi:hypothetical protein